MCNTTCNNHTHEEYNIDYINKEEALNITSEDVPCQHEQNIYIIDGEYNKDEQCSCEYSECNEPKKVSCRSLACQQLNDECSCKRKKKKIRKTTMVNVLENNVLRLEDKMNSGCADMHESIEDLENNINLVYNELKDEEARAKKQEAFLHYGLDDAVTRAEYNPEDRKIYFYHKNPLNCLNVNVHEGCDCDCCNACGCECNIGECSSDIPYTMDDNCNIIPMKRNEEKLPFEIDCRDFLTNLMPTDFPRHVSSASVSSDGNTLTLTHSDGDVVTFSGGGGSSEPARHITNISQNSETGDVTFTWSDGGVDIISVGGGSGTGECLWAEYGDGVIPKNGKVVYGPGFYDTTVN